MTRLELLNSRGFKDEKDLETFLENCQDEGWKKELIEFYGIEPKAKTTKKDGSKNKKDKEIIREVEIDETVNEETVEDTIETDEVVVPEENLE